jgi:hypothetical protein
MIRGSIGILLIIATTFAADWRRYRSPNFELFSDSREATARRVLERLERIRHAFLDTWGSRRSIPVRLSLPVPTGLPCIFSERRHAGFIKRS